MYDLKAILLRGRSLSMYGI